MKEKELPLKIQGVQAKIVYYTYMGFNANTLLVSFNEKRRVLSTTDGYKKVKYVANAYVPYAVSEHFISSYKNFRKSFLEALGISHDDLALLSTGVNIDNLAICEQSFQEFSVCCMVTAGVKGNAQRVGVDTASYIEKNGEFLKISGTINIILLTNAVLSVGSMARAIMTITEAKTAALQDLDVRSTFTPQCQATGTGTDNAIVVSGKSGEKIKFLGGHTKLGELIGFSTKNAVTEAIRLRKY